MQKSITFPNITRTISVFCLVALSITYSPFLFAAKSPSEIELDPKQDDTSKPTAEEIERAQGVHVSPSPPLSRESSLDKDYFFKYRNALTIRSGVENIQEPGPLFGLLLLYSTRDLRSFEGGVDFTRGGNGNTNGTIHFAFHHLSSREGFRWFYKYGAGIRIVGSDQLVTFLRLRNWQLRAGGGAEWTLSDPVSLRFEIEGIAGSEKLDALATAGLSFAW